jgi:hypothetical protein
MNSKPSGEPASCFARRFAEAVLKCGASDGSTTLDVMPTETGLAAAAPAGGGVAFAFGDGEADGEATGLAKAIVPPQPAIDGNAWEETVSPTVATFEAETGVAVAAAGATGTGFIPFWGAPGSVLWPPPRLPEQAASTAHPANDQKTREKIIVGRLSRPMSFSSTLGRALTHAQPS